MAEQRIGDSVSGREIHDEIVERRNTSPPTSSPNAAVTEPPQLSVLVQQWTNRALDFFSHASNETLGACFVGLGASTYLILGRVGLVLIGVVGGIALHATWDGSSVGPSAVEADAEARKRREMGLEVVQRVWRWRDRARLNQDSEMEDKIDVELYQGKRLDFADFRPSTSAALDIFTNAVIKDYVKWWYAPVLPGEEEFPSACRQILTAFIRGISLHVSRKRPSEVFLDFIINSSSIVIAFLSELSAALNASPNSDAATAVETYIQLKPDSTLAQMLDHSAQDKKLVAIAEDILQNYLDPKAYNLAPVHVFLQQILSKLILSTTLDTCSKGEWINGWITYLLEDGEPDLMRVIDDGVEGAGKHESKPSTDAKASDEAKATHKRQVSRAEEAMDQAMQEAQRLTQMIREEDLKRRQDQSSATSSSDDMVTQGMQTPTSSQDESEKAEAAVRSIAEPVPELAEPHDAVPSITGDQLLHTTPAVVEDSRPVLTLQGAKISIFDDSMPGERALIKSKPTAEYLVQIEPADSRFSGWMIARRYADFEVLHEVLRRISVIAGVRFVEAHASLPAWKQNTKTNLRTDLECYLADAVKFQQLAECEGMKRFLEKDQGLSKSPSANKGLGWPDPMSVGKGMMDVLTKAPKEVAGGSKALLGGVTSVLGGAGKKPSTSKPTGLRSDSSNSLVATTTASGRTSFDAQRRQTDTDRSASRVSVEDATGTARSPAHDPRTRPSLSSRASLSSRPSTDDAKSDGFASGTQSPGRSTPPMISSLNLPPPPSLIDDHEPASALSPHSVQVPVVSTTPAASQTAAKPSTASTRTNAPLSEQEATVTLDLLFATITELYTLSSAWTFRRTLLTAARTYLLRPGNPQLEAIRAMIQESVIDANSSDAGLARLILKTRENSLPTEEELKAWPAPLMDKEKAELRVTARKLLVERGMPQALTSVMGAAASGEALGKVFDCLQVESVARSLMFGLMLQGLRAVVQ